MGYSIGPAYAERRSSWEFLLRTLVTNIQLQRYPQDSTRPLQKPPIPRRKGCPEALYLFPSGKDRACSRRWKHLHAPSFLHWGDWLYAESSISYILSICQLPDTFCILACKILLLISLLESQNSLRVPFTSWVCWCSPHTHFLFSHSSHGEILL